MALPALRLLPLATALATLAAPAAAQLTWTEIKSPQSPSPRFGHAFASGSYLFGGRDTKQAFADTWLWTGFYWQTLPTSASPSARHGHAMAYQSTGPLLFGGADAAGNTNGETWRLGATWTQLTTQHAPSPRHGHAMMNDWWTNRVFLFGGLTTTGASDELWCFENGDWQLLATDRKPPARHGHALLSSRQGGVLLVGGSDGATTFDDTWRFDGQAWTRLAVVPFAASGVATASLGFERRRDLFVGGIDASGAMRTTVHERGANGTWFEQPTAGAIPARQQAIASDNLFCAPGGIVTTAIVFGGRDANGRALGDTWQLAPAHIANYEWSGTGCGPGGWGLDGPNLSLSSVTIGNTDDIRIFTLTPNTLVVLGAQLGVAAPPACSITIEPQLTMFAVSDAPFGMATIPLAVPFTPLLRGESISLQCIALEPMWQPTGLAVSRLGILRLGD
jgi:hypothetical protein